LDPRILEKTLNTCSVIAHSAVVGNNFIAGAADFVCAIVELNEEGAKNVRASSAQITKTLSVINRGLAPPLRIAWSRVLVLDKGQNIPYTRKRTIFRKKLQEIFGEQLTSLLSTPPSKEFASNVGKPAATELPPTPPVTPDPMARRDPLLSAAVTSTSKAAAPAISPSSTPSVPETEVRRIVFDAVCTTLGISAHILRANVESTFAEVCTLHYLSFHICP
jgi:hypothetical protein